MRKSLLIGALALLLAGCGVSRAEEKGDSPSAVTPSSASSSSRRTLQPLKTASEPLAASSSSRTPSRPVPSIAPAISLDVPFTSQAPHKNWDEPYQNACEETAILMVMHYLENKTFPTPEYADGLIVDLTNKTSGMGYGTSVSMGQLADIVRTLYPDYEPVLSTDVTIDSLKRELTQGRPVIVPAAGRMLNNPYYSGEGPWYHMLVVTGYDDTFFYTNDMGTGVGYRYPYPHRVLVDAIHDWVGQDERIEEGPKVMMTLRRK